MTLKKLSFALAAVSVFGLASAANAATLSLSGGSGSVVVISVPSLTFAITVTGPAATPLFAIDELAAQGFGPLAPSGFTFSINGGAPTSITFATSGYERQDVTPNDVYMFGLPISVGGVVAGDTVVLSAGTLTSNLPVAAAVPGTLTTDVFVFDNQGLRVGSLAPSAVPEPTNALFTGLLLGSASLLRFRTRRLLSA